jgi:hypothetical protein
MILVHIRKAWLWAEPDFEQAVEYMKKLYYDRAFATNLGKKPTTLLKNNIL